jgi:hypothetical protein
MGLRALSVLTLVNDGLFFWRHDCCGVTDFIAQRESGMTRLRGCDFIRDNWCKIFTEQNLFQ